MKTSHHSLHPCLSLHPALTFPEGFLIFFFYLNAFLRTVWKSQQHLCTCWGLRSCLFSKVGRRSTVWLNCPQGRCRLFINLGLLTKHQLFYPLNCFSSRNCESFSFAFATTHGASVPFRGQVLLSGGPAPAVPAGPPD